MKEITLNTRSKVSTQKIILFKNLVFSVMSCFYGNKVCKTGFANPISPVQ